MKISKEQLKQIIKEELAAIEGTNMHVTESVDEAHIGLVVQALGSLPQGPAVDQVISAINADPLIVIAALESMKEPV